MMKHKHHTDPLEGCTLPGIPDLKRISHDAPRPSPSDQELTARELIEYHGHPERMTARELFDIDDL